MNSQELFTFEVHPFSPTVHENVHGSLPMLHIKITIQDIIKHIT